MRRTLLIYVALFLVLLPASLSIKYMQNDEWVHYATVTNFLQGNYTLHHYLGSNFYLMGLMAVVFSSVFGVARLPVLTLVISLITTYVLNLLLLNIYKLRWSDALLISLLFLVNPLFVYGMWGFMIDNYALLFFVLSLYFYLTATENVTAFELKRLLLFLAIGNLWAILGYFVKQTSAITIAAAALYFGGRIIFTSGRAFRKKYLILAFFQLAVFILLMIYHFYLFPKNSVMWENKLVLGNLFYFRYMFSLFLIAGIYLCSFTLPLVISYLARVTLIRRWWFKGLVAISLIFSLVYFKPTIRWNDSYYYMQNVLQTKGYFVENLHGKKPAFAYSGSIHSTMDTISKVLFMAMVLTIIIIRRFDFLLLYLIVYLAALGTSLAIFDRYLLPVFAVALIYLAKQLKDQWSFWTSWGAAIFIVCLGLYSYNFSADYILTNNYVWARAVELTDDYDIPKGNIVATSAWRYLGEGTGIKVDYKFTYDPPWSAEYSDTNRFTLVELKEIDYPLKFWNRIQIYLYRIN